MIIGVAYFQSRRLPRIQLYSSSNISYQFNLDEVVGRGAGDSEQQGVQLGRAEAHGQLVGFRVRSLVLGEREAYYSAQLTECVGDAVYKRPDEKEKKI